MLVSFKKKNDIDIIANNKTIDYSLKLFEIKKILYNISY